MVIRFCVVIEFTVFTPVGLQLGRFKGPFQNVPGSYEKDQKHKGNSPGETCFS